MAWTTLANLRGPQGDSVDDATILGDGHLSIQLTDGTTLDAGDARGPQGIPGTGAVPADDAVAGYISTAGTSATKTALLAGFVRKGTIVFNVLDYGAVDNVATDSATAIQAAMDAAAGKGAVLVPPGNYGIGATLRLPAGTILSGYGATFHRLSSANTMCMNWAAGDTTTTAYNGRGNIVLAGLIWDAHADTVLGEANILSFDHAAKIRCQDMTFRRTSAFHGIEFNAIDGAIVDGCVFEGYTNNSAQVNKEAIQIDCAVGPDGGASDNTMSKNITVSNSVVRPYGALPAHPSLVGSHSRVAGQFYDNIRVVNCAGDSPSYTLVAAYAWRSSIISGCSVTNSGSQGFRVEACESVTVIGCTTINSAKQGIVLGIGSMRCKIVSCTVLGNLSTEGIYDGAGDVGNIISGNIVYRPVSYGITVDGALSVMVANNKIVGAGYAAGQAGAIRVTGNADQTTIVGNVVEKHNAGTEVLAGVSVNTGSTNTWVFGNSFKGIATAISGAADTTSNRI